MKTLVFFAVLICLTSFVLSQAQTQCNSPLLKSNDNPDGVPGVAQAQTVTGLKNCQSLEGKSACCTNETINGFRTTLTNLMDGLKNRVGEKDKKMAKIMFSMGKMMNKTLEILQKMSSIPKRMLQGLTSGEDIKFVNQANKEMKDGFQYLMKNRSSCFSHVFQITSKLLCMSCMSDTSAFIKNGQLKISNKTCNNLLVKCGGFFASLPMLAQFGSQETVDALANQEANMNKVAKIVDDMKSAADSKDPNAIQKAATQMVENMQLFESISKLGKMTISSMQKPKLPPGCNSTACNLICERIISNKGVNVTALENGGMDIENVKNAPMFPEGMRLLVVSDDGFDVEANVSSGFESTVAFPENPANANPETGQSSGSSAASILNIFVLIFAGLIAFL